MAFRLGSIKAAGILFAGAVGALALAAAPAKEDTTSLEGKPAPEVTLRTSEGKAFKLSELKGNVVLMDYWATWCPPCRLSLPHVNDMSKDKELFGKGLRVVAINNGETVPEVKKFVKENNYSFAVPMDPTMKFGRDYKVRGIPTSVIVGRDGTIAKVFIGFGEGSETALKKEIEKALEVEAPTPAKSTTK